MYMYYHIPVRYYTKGDMTVSMCRANGKVCEGDLIRCNGAWFYVTGKYLYGNTYLRVLKTWVALELSSNIENVQDGPFIRFKYNLASNDSYSRGKFIVVGSAGIAGWVI